MEQLKAALNTGWVSILTGLLVHLLPLAACITLIYLKVKSHLVSTHVSTLAFQFLAKFLELLAQASLGSAVFVNLRALYTGRDPVPFGALFAGLQITKVSHLWSLKFAGVVISKNFKQSRKDVFVLLIPLSVVIAVSIGPSLAIALTPTLGEFYDGRAEAWINATEDQIFPSYIDPTASVYNFSSNCSTGDCARYGWETAISIAQLTQQTHNNLSTQQQAGHADVQNTISISPVTQFLGNQLVSSQMNSMSVSPVNITASWLNQTLPDLSTLLDFGIAEVDAATFIATSLAVSMAQWPKQVLNNVNDPPNSSGHGGVSDVGIIVGSTVPSSSDPNAGIPIVDSSILMAWPNRSLQWLGSSDKNHVFYAGSEYAEAEGKYRMRFDVSSHGYGYQVNQPTKVIAIAVLAAYCCYITIFIVITLTLNRDHSNAWDSIGELTALAIMSRPEYKLRNTSAGIETVALFRLPMNIRTVDKDHLEILFGEDEGGPIPGTVKKDKKYK